MTANNLTGREDSQELQLEFHGCIVSLPSDKSQKPAKLTIEQSEALAELLYSCFKRWYGL